MSTTKLNTVIMSWGLKIRNSKPVQTQISFLNSQVSVSMSLKYWLLVCSYFLKDKLEKYHPPYSDRCPRGKGGTWVNLEDDYGIF